MIGLEYNSPMPASIILSIRKVSNAVRIDIFIFLYSLAPKYILVMTDAPIPPPIAMEINTVVNE